MITESFIITGFDKYGRDVAEAMCFDADRVEVHVENLHSLPNVVATKVEKEKGYVADAETVDFWDSRQQEK